MRVLLQSIQVILPGIRNAPVVLLNDLSFCCRVRPVCKHFPVAVHRHCVPSLLVCMILAH